MTANDIVGDARVARVRELKTELAAAKARVQEVESERDALKAHFDLALVALRDFEQLGPKGRLRIIDGWNAILRYRNVSKLTSEDISKLKDAYLADLGIEQSSRVSCGLHSLSLTSPAGTESGGRQASEASCGTSTLISPAEAGSGGRRTSETSCGSSGLVSPAEGVSGDSSVGEASSGASFCGRNERERMESAGEGVVSYHLSATTDQRPTFIWIVFDGSEENSYRHGSYRVTYTGGTGPHRADRLILDYVHAAKLLGLGTSRITVETADKTLAKKLESFGAVVASN